MTEAAALPPPMKNAGVIGSHDLVGGGFMAVVAVPVLVMITGAVLLALMTSRRRSLGGFAVHIAAGFIALSIMGAFVFMIMGQNPGGRPMSALAGLIDVAWPFGVLWLLLAGLGFGVGRLARIPGKPTPPA